MKIEIIPYTLEQEVAVKAFNKRVAAANLDSDLYSVHFHESYIPPWLPRCTQSELYQEYFLAIDNQGIMRGGYRFKHQPFILKGKPVRLLDYQMAISEGIIDRAFAMVGTLLYRDAIHRHPLLWGLGSGGLHVPFAKFILSAGWQSTPVPFWFRVVNPNKFLKNIIVLRNSTFRRMLFDFLRCSGLGWLGIKAAFGLKGNDHLPTNVTFEVVSEFLEWADEVWTKCRDDYSLIAVRDSQILNILYPGANPRFIRLKVTRGNSVIGWAVLLNTQMSGHKQFGDMRVGTIVDCLAKPIDAPDVVACARKVLEMGSADLIISNQASRAWCQALRHGGFMEGPSNYPFFLSPNLAALLQPLDECALSFHLNRGDGDGPIHL